MLRRYRLLVVAAVVALVAVDGARDTQPEPTNSIRDDLFNENEQLLPTSPSGNQTLEETASGDGQLPTADDPAVNGTTDSDWRNVWPYFDTGCLQWLPINHLYFQLANSFLLLSYLAPAGIYGLLYLRLMLAIGCAFFALWGWIILCAFDTFLWNAFFTLINVAHGFYLLCSLRPVRFDEHVEEVYKQIFQPLKVSKQQFKKVVGCMKSIRPLKRGEHFAVEKKTRVENLSLLLSGSMLMIENGKTLHVLHPMQFLDSPEWFGVSSDEFFQVSIRACEECRILLWHRDKLKLTLQSDAFLSAVFDHILGRDVVRKLTQMKEKISSPSQAGSPFRSHFNGSLDGDKSSSPLSKSSVHEHGGLVVAPEQLTLLDETKAKTNVTHGPNKGAIGFGFTQNSNNATANRLDYSVVQHLDSTDI